MTLGDISAALARAGHPMPMRRVFEHLVRLNILPIGAGSPAIYPNDTAQKLLTSLGNARALEGQAGKGD